MSSLGEIHKLEDRYPFNEAEIEVLLRCYESIRDDVNNDTFLMKLAMCSPYSYFFLPGDELRKRVTFVEDYVLPAGFPNELKAAIGSDAFVDYANAGEEKSLERFLEGIADTGRRGPKEALRVIYDIIDQPKPSELIDMCYRLSIAADVIVSPSVNKDMIMDKLNEEPVKSCVALTKSLEAACMTRAKENGKTYDFVNDDNSFCPRNVFFQWAEESVPLLSSTLSTFVHNLLFHGHDYPKSRTPYVKPLLEHASDIFDSSDTSPLLFPLSCTTHHFGGKWHRLYSAEMDGRSFKCLEYTILGYSGPSLLVIQTEDDDAVLGAFASSPWKESNDFYGNSDCFVFQLHPTLGIYRPTGKDNHFMYCNPEIRSSIPMRTDGHKHGIGFGGSIDEPRLFIPETLEECSAHYLDTTYKKGDLLPKDAMERFKIKYLEVWGVGGDEVIKQSLRDRADYREKMDTTLTKARSVTDKKQFVDDLSTGLIPNKLFDHKKDMRGRNEFLVDEVHGGYKLDHNIQDKTYEPGIKDV